MEPNEISNVIPIQNEIQPGNTKHATFDFIFQADLDNEYCHVILDFVEESDCINDGK